MQTASEQIRGLVADAKTRVAAARSPDEVREVLTRVSERIFGRGQQSPSTALLEEAKHAFFTEQYANWAHFLLKSVLPNWVLCFSREERARFFDSFFTSPEVPQVDAFLALAQALIEYGRSDDAARTGGTQWNEGLRAKNHLVLEVRHRPTPTATEEAVDESEQGTNKDEKDFIVKTVAWLLGTMVATDGGLSRLFAHFARHEGPHAGQESLWVRVLGLLCSLPDRISAVYRDAASEIPHALREQQFTRLVTTQALNALQLKHVSERALLAHIGQLYGKLGLVGRGTTMMEALLPLILAHIHDREWRSRFVAIVRAIPQNAAEGFVHALLLQLDSTTQFSSDFIATTRLAVTQGTQAEASRAQHALPLLYQLRSQVLLELFGETVSHADSRGEHASGKRNDNALSFLFLHKLLLVKVYPASVLRVLLDFIARLSPTPPTDKGKEKDTTGADGMDEGTRVMQLLLNALVKVVGVWGEKSFIRHSSYEQHRYLFKAITFGLSYLTKEDLTSADGLLIGLVSGVQNYIAYPVGRTRRFGMIVAEQFSRILDPEAEKPLEFEYQPLSDDEDKEEVLANEGAADAIERASTASTEDVTPPTERKQRRRRKKKVDDPDALFLANEEEAPEDDVVGDEDLQLEGSEDDTGGSSENELEAYDLEDDESDLSQVKIPVYLRDVLAGLRAKDEPDRLEGAIKAAEGLIRADARGDLHDISLDLMRTLLHLFNQYELEGFGEMRFKAMIALLASDEETPKLVKYLTDQFYAQNYSIQQRIDMLVVMAEAAKELADSSLEPMFPPSSSHAKAIEAPAEQGQPLLRESKDINLRSGLSPARFASLYIDRDSRRLTFEEDDQRLPYLPSHDSTNDTAESSTMVIKHSKLLGKETRRMGGRKGPAFAQSGKANRFVDVHGLFFYPLMRGYDSVDNTFNLLGEDSIVLSKLLHALSVFIECMGSAAPPSALYRMVRALVDFVWSVRYHREANVRRAALLAAARTIALVPVNLLVSDFLEDFNEVQAWLVSVYRDDPDEHSRALASASLLELRKVAESVTRQQLNDPTNLLSG